MSSLNYSTDLTNEEREHFDRCMKYTLKYISIFEPFYMYPLYKVNLSAKKTKIRNLGYTDGLTITICYPVALKLTEAQFAGLMLHELMHVLNLHIPRLKERHISVWNIATDIVINETIAKQETSTNNKIVLPPNGVRSPSLGKLSAEEIYDLLLKNKVPNFRIKQTHKSSGSGNSNPGESGDSDSQSDGNGGENNPINPLEEAITIEVKDERTGEWRPIYTEYDLQKAQLGKDGFDERAKQLLREARQAHGKMGLGIERTTVDILDEVKVDWKRELRKYITRNSSDYSFTQRDRRFHDTPFFVPGLETTDKGSLKIKVGIDLSGSIGAEDISKMITECLGIERQFTSVEFQFVPFDVDTYGTFTAKNKNEVFKAFQKFKGGGGTSFVKVLEELDTKDAIVILMFTDLYGAFPKKKPKTDVIWLDINGSYKDEIPFGRIIYYEKQATR